MSTDNDIWEARYTEIQGVKIAVYTFDDLVLLIASFSILILVTCKYKRRDFFLLAIPSLFFTRGLLQIPTNYVSLFTEGDEAWLPYLMSTSYVYRIGHWLFSSQYLQTSIIFPKLFIAAQFELKAEKNLKMTENSGIHVQNFLLSFKSCDHIIQQQKESIQRT